MPTAPSPTTHQFGHQCRRRQGQPPWIRRPSLCAQPRHPRPGIVLRRCCERRRPGPGPARLPASWSRRRTAWCVRADACCPRPADCGTS